MNQLMNGLQSGKIVSKDHIFKAKSNHSLEDKENISNCNSSNTLDYNS